jgi:hypothetical protein
MSPNDSNYCNDGEWLWSGGSVWCKCGHHLIEHQNGSAYWQKYPCLFKMIQHYDEGGCAGVEMPCGCIEFVSYKVKEEKEENQN